MHDLGICSETNAIYEGSRTTIGYRVVPSPLLLPIRFVWSDTVRPIDNIDGYSAEVFREESFDPVSKIRRGRVFTRRHHQSLKFDWHVHDPIREDLPIVHWRYGDAQFITLVSYAADTLPDLRKREAVRHPPKVVLGWEEHSTWWKIVAVESPIRSAPVLTLRALFTFGDLPELIEEAIPSDIRTSLVEALDKVDNATNRIAPVDVIDRCRDALSIVFGHLSGAMGRDLGDAVSAYIASGKREDLHACSGRIVARLHSRGKPSEQHAKGLRPPTDDDAQLAVRCLGVILVDLGWAQ